MALQGVAEPGTAAKAPKINGLIPTTSLVVRRVQVGAIHGARHVLKVHDRVRRIMVTRHMGQAALLANGFAVVGLMIYALIATVDNYIQPDRSVSFQDDELPVLAPLCLAALSFAVALHFFSRRQYRSTFKISAPLSFAVALSGLVLYLHNPEALDRILQRFHDGLRPATLTIPQNTTSQMWTGH